MATKRKCLCVENSDQTRRKGCVALRLCYTSSATDISVSENLYYAEIVRYVYSVFIAAVAIWSSLSFSS
jgi:hypothetical protein